MARRRSTVTVVTLLTLFIVGFFAMQTISFDTQRRNVHARAQDMREAYAQAAQHFAAPLADLPSLTSQQRNLIIVIDAHRAAIAQPLPLAETIESVAKLQQAFAQLFGYTQGKGGIENDPLYTALVQEMTNPSGSVLTALNAYNESANQWNQMLQEPVGSLMGRMRSAERAYLLSTDGNAEFMTTVQL